MSIQNFYIPNRFPNFWKENRVDCNCGSFALNTPSWVSPYDNDGNYTNETRTKIIQDMFEEGFSKEQIMDTILTLDQEALLKACYWIEPVLPAEILPDDRVVAYRLCLDEDALENGEVDDDYHFRVRINGFWFEKCGQEPIRFCGIDFDEEPWKVAPYLIYDSEICYFRFKK